MVCSGGSTRIDNIVIGALTEVCDSVEIGVFFASSGLCKMEI
jgi:hypothetical protein